MDEAYDLEYTLARQDMEEYGEDYATGLLTLEEFEDRMRARIYVLFLALAMLASQNEFDPEVPDQDREDFLLLLGGAYETLDSLIGFLRDNGELSIPYTRWRAGLFANARQVYIRFSVGHDVYELMPLLPGLDCLGDGACKCSLRVNYFGNQVEVIWELGVAEHCDVCLQAAANSPYTFTL